MQAYTGCLRCAGAPRRPASGSELSLAVPSRHAVLVDPGELAGCMRPVPSPATRSSPSSDGLDAHQNPAIRFKRGIHFGADSIRSSLRPVELLASFGGSDSWLILCTHMPFVRSKRAQGMALAGLEVVPPVLLPAHEGEEIVPLPTETFTPGLPAVRSPSPLPGMTTVATGQVPPAGLPPAGTAASFAATDDADLYAGQPRAYPSGQEPVGPLGHPGGQGARVGERGGPWPLLTARSPRAALL
jgi:hypothetical protein